MESLIIIVFVLGYLAITLEHNLKIDKLIPALGMMAVIWALISLGHLNVFEVNTTELRLEATHLDEILLHHLGKTAETISQIASGQHSFCSELVQASNPIIIVGSNVLNRDDSEVVSGMLTQIDRNTASVKGSLNSILSVIQPNASQYGAAQLGLDSFNPSFE